MKLYTNLLNDLIDLTALFFLSSSSIDRGYLIYQHRNYPAQGPLQFQFFQSHNAFFCQNPTTLVCAYHLQKDPEEPTQEVPVSESPTPPLLLALTDAQNSVLQQLQLHPY